MDRGIRQEDGGSTSLTNRTFGKFPAFGPSATLRTGRMTFDIQYIMNILFGKQTLRWLELKMHTSLRWCDGGSTSLTNRTFCKFPAFGPLALLRTDRMTDENAVLM